MPAPLHFCAALAASTLVALSLGACGDGDGGPEPPARPDARTQPAGIYRYATEGFERIGGPLPGRLAYPATTTITVERSGCTLSERWEARPERYAEWRYCVTGTTWRLRSVTDYHEFFGNAQRRAYRCTGRAVPRPARIEEGFRWTDRCRARSTTAVARGEVLAGARGEREREADHRRPSACSHAPRWRRARRLHDGLVAAAHRRAAAAAHVHRRQPGRRDHRGRAGTRGIRAAAAFAHAGG